jgi:DNA-binding helix-hairpin-helix protein with protein kinase domain
MVQSGTLTKYYRASSGAEIQYLAKELGHGAQGVVYPVENSDTVIKIFFNSQSSQDEMQLSILKEKVHQLLQFKGNDVIALPVDSIIDETGNFCGYLMPVVEIGKSIKNLDSNIDRISLPQRYQICKDLIATAVQLESYGVAIVDWNPPNFLIKKDKRVCLIDSDNFQIRLSDGSYLNANAYVKEYLSPELLLDETTWSPFLPGNQRTPAHESWSLAVALYRVLLLHHPFEVGKHGIFANGCTDDTIKEDEFKRRVCEGNFANDVELFYAHERSLSIVTLPTNIYKAFFTTFFLSVNQPEFRLTPREWLHCFREANSEIKECRGPNKHLIFVDGCGNLCPVCGF